MTTQQSCFELCFSISSIESLSTDDVVFWPNQLNPVDFDLCVCKSPNGFRTHFQAIAESIVPVDVPGSTSANLLSLPYTRCPRPMFPLDDDVTASIEAVIKE